MGVRVGVSLVVALSFFSCGGGTGSAPTGNGSGSLAGVWDGIGTRFGQNAAAVTVTIDAHQLIIDNKTATVTATAQGDDFLVDYWKVPFTDGHLKFLAHRASPPSASLGALPINLSGQWQAEDLEGHTDFGCTTSLAASALDASCLRTWRTGPYAVTPVAWLPDPSHVTLSGTRTASATSIFGDLGGTWQIDEPGVGGCTVQIHDSVIDATCSGGPNMQGTFHVEVAGNTLSGSTSKGVEFSAHHR